MRYLTKGSLLLSTAMFAASVSLAATQLSPIDLPIVLSDGSGEQSPDLNSTSKTKLVRLSNSAPTHGRLISVFSDSWGDETFPDGHAVYDVKAQAERAARDIFMRYSDDDGVTWSATVNLSNTAAFSSMDTQWRGEGTEASAFYGDSDKPNIFNSANIVAVSWVDKLCDATKQSSVAYVERDMREIPFSCTYIARSMDGGTTWGAAERLSDGARDAKQDVNRGGSKFWAVTWQEDPAGLGLGQAEGPGDGASGATVSHGTDIWYSYLPAADFAAGTFSEPVRLTNNWTKMEDKRNTGNEIQSGQEGASRANLGVMGGTVIVAYEETKGSEGVDVGKYVRYHSFPFAAPPSTVAGACLPDLPTQDSIPAGVDCTSADLPPNPLLPESAGCILSKPEQNARRVRFMPQGIAGPSGTKLFIFWKQGEYDQGGPSDIVGRYATDVMDLSTFSPALSLPTADTMDGCLIRGDDDPASGAFLNTAALNLSHDTPNGGDLTADSDDNSIEDARAHRGYIRGDTIVLGYSYTPDGVLARATDQEHYNFWIRRSLDGGATWGAGLDMTSALIQKFVEENTQYTSVTQIDVKEPRIVKTPGNGPLACPSGDPEAVDTTDPSECSNGKGFIVAGGLVENTYEHLGSGAELDLFITRSTDAGATYEKPIVLAGTAAEEFESQIRMTPSLDKVFAVWNSSDELAGKNGHFLAMDVIEVADEVVPVEPAPEVATAAAATSDSSGGGGSLTPVMLMVLTLLGFVVRRRQRR
ncbi:MAG: choice-of-anchor O protein [Pontibacterium sp.]